MPTGVYKHNKPTKKQLEALKKGSIKFGFQKGHSQSNTGRTHFKKGIATQLGKHWKVKDTSRMNKKQIGKRGYWKDKKLSEKHRRKLSEALNGEKSNLWRGGITTINAKIRTSIEFRLWREAVFARDNWTCQKYKVRGVKLVAHHIQNFSQHPELRFAIDNGITFSDKAHREFHRKYGRRNNTREQLKKYLKDYGNEPSTTAGEDKGE